MKSQDILLLLKLVSLEIRDREGGRPRIDGWQDWELESAAPGGSALLAQELGWEDRSDVHLKASPSAMVTLSRAESPRGEGELEYSDAGERNKAEFSVRGLADSTGISKSQVSLSLQRCFEAGLAKLDRRDGVPRANAKALGELLIHGIRYVFPAKPGEVTRGIATSLGAPVLEGKLMSAGEIVPVWPDPRGNTKGAAIIPFAPSVPNAVRKDSRLYALLALTDAIRIGQPRERNLASEMLESMLKVT
ncbi:MULTISPECIES: hypothetical protein [unclassified Cupriavidus]|uniref:hypothetical protein n=1 Tax=unclassified Cupriavidus TaxID=2640874 RepID=UPI00313C1598